MYIKCYLQTLSWNFKVASFPEVLSIHKAYSSLGDHSTLVYYHVNFTWGVTVSRNLYWLFLVYLLDFRISSGYITSNNKILEWKWIGKGKCSFCVTYARMPPLIWKEWINSWKTVGRIIEWDMNNGFSEYELMVLTFNDDQSLCLWWKCTVQWIVVHEGTDWPRGFLHGGAAQLSRGWWMTVKFSKRIL